MSTRPEKGRFEDFLLILLVFPHFGDVWLVGGGTLSKSGLARAAVASDLRPSPAVWAATSPAAPTRTKIVSNSRARTKFVAYI